MEEIWKTISICPKYEVSNLGNIRNAKNKKIRKTFLEKNKLKIELNKKANLRNLSVARLVYNAFADEHAPDNCKVILIDKNPYNCRFDNLRLKHCYGMIPSKEQLKVFNENVYAVVKWYLFKHEKFNPYDNYWGGLTNDDLIQDCVMAIYEYLPMYDSKSKFTTFCRAVIRTRHICSKYHVENLAKRDRLISCVKRKRFIDVN